MPRARAAADDWGGNRTVRDDNEMRSEAQRAQMESGDFSARVS